MVHYNNKDGIDKGETVICCNCFDMHKINPKQQEKVRTFLDYLSRQNNHICY